MLDLVLRPYMDPVFDCTYVLDAQVMFSCVEEWKSNKMLDMFKQLELAPFSRPVLFLQVENITLYGDPEEYKLFRSKPLSYQIRPFDHLHGPGYAHSQTLVQMRLHIHVHVHVKMHIHTLSPAPCLSLSRSLSFSLSYACTFTHHLSFSHSVFLVFCLFRSLALSRPPPHTCTHTHNRSLSISLAGPFLSIHTRAISHECKNAV